MKRLRNHLVGVDQGSIFLFSDFENGGPMWSGNGIRRCQTKVKFSHAFKTAPAVHVSLDMLDMDKSTNQRADLSVDNISTRGFDIVFKTWDDTKIARVRAAWLAIGEFPGDDEWDMD
jgi:H-type lectin domain-containing protein